MGLRGEVGPLLRLWRERATPTCVIDAARARGMSGPAARRAHRPFPAKHLSRVNTHGLLPPRCPSSGTQQGARITEPRLSESLQQQLQYLFSQQCSITSSESRMTLPGTAQVCARHLRPYNAAQAASERQQKPWRLPAGPLEKG